MGMSYTVIQRDRQHFGNQPGSFNDIEPDVPFVGQARDFAFDCPSVKTDDTAVLLFQSRDVSHALNIVHLNGIPLAGGLPVSPSRDTWNGNVLLVERHHGLKAIGNVLRVESRNAGGGLDGDIDEFILDNVVIQYRTAELSDDGIFNVRRYGANGDGGHGDFLAILAALNALSANGGGVLFFPKGIYALLDTLELGANTTVVGSGGGSVLVAKTKEPGDPCFNMLHVQSVDNVHIRDLVLDGNCAATKAPPVGEENVGCGVLAEPREGQTGLSITGVIVRNHHRAGIRILGPASSLDPDSPKRNDVVVSGCEIADCASRGIFIVRATRARIVGNVVTRCTQAGIQLAISRCAVIDGNVVEATRQRPDTTAGHGISAANSFDYAIINNVVSRNARWGIVASGGIGLTPDGGYPMSHHYVVANNMCRDNVSGGITLDPSTRDPVTDEPTGIIHDSFATVSSNVCAGNTGAGIHTIHAGYVAVHGNVCDGTNLSGPSESAGIAIVASRRAVVADNVLIANKFGVSFWGNPDETPDTSPPMGDHLLGANVYDGKGDEIQIGPYHPAVRQLHERPPNTDWGGINLPVKSDGGDPAHAVDGVLYLNPDDRKLQLFAKGAWRTLQTTSGTSW
jgi:parallel beta helix pectate lyase-like protein